MNDHRFKILLCIDGSEESHRGLSYAVKVSRGNDADITLLYVRPVDKTGRSAGLDMRVARENMLEWGLELPGMDILEREHQALIKMGYMDDDWKFETVHREVMGDPLGDNMVVYTSAAGESIILKLMVSPTIARGILDECEMNEYDLTILAMSDEDEKARHSINWGVTRAVVSEHRGTVLLARDIQENHGHLICVNQDEKSIEAARKDAIMASRCECPVHLLSVAATEDEVPVAETAITWARSAINKAGVEVVDSTVAVGDPIEQIIEHGKPYSVIVLADTHVKGLRRIFQTSVAYEVLQKAYNSVMIVR
ncbi:MAG: universal stress protein [Hyphomonadaceae bacterium]